MDEIRDDFHHGRRAMIDAFAELTTIALRAGVDWDRITEIHGRFFDGNVELRRAFRTAMFLAEIRDR
jgi:hypothetical protein